MIEFCNCILKTPYVESSCLDLFLEGITDEAYDKSLLNSQSVDHPQFTSFLLHHVLLL